MFENDKYFYDPDLEFDGLNLLPNYDSSQSALGPIEVIVTQINVFKSSVSV